MSPGRVERKLAAILAADVAGYARLIGADEEGTLAALKAHRLELIDPAIAEHRGRIVKTMGDGILAEFGSVVEAVRCAIAMQQGLAKRNAAIAPETRIEFRVGIHVGDIVMDGEDILGDGVNVSARLEAVAEPGGICVSRRVYEDARGKLAAEFEDMGEHQLKHIRWPVHVFRVKPDDAARPLQPALALPDKPSIAVLPFQNMSGDPEQDYFADGMVEDIITGLSRIGWVFVIARNSSFVYKGKPINIKQVGRELGVRYVLEGSVRKAGNRVRIAGQLIEVENGAHLWADKFDGTIDDVFDLQDRIAASVVGVVEPSLRQAEIQRAKRKRPDSLDAYDLYLHALPYMNSVVPEDARVAMGFLQNAVTRDPTYGAALAALAWCQMTCFLHAGFDQEDRTKAVQHARAAIAAGTDDAAALAFAAVVILLLDRDRETAVRVIDRAVDFNGASATALFFGARIHAWNGDCAVATELARRALRLSPFDPFSHFAHFARGLVGVQEERYDDAALSFAKGAQVSPRFTSLYAAHAAALALAGRLSEASVVTRRLLELEPSFRCRLWHQVGLVPSIADKLFTGLRQLGLPE